MFKSYGITIRPKCGVSEELQNVILEKINKFKNLDSCYMIAEKEGIERHLHLQVWFNEPRRKGDLKKQLERTLSSYDWWDTHHKRYCIHIKIAYNDWITNYCLENETKGDILEEIQAEIPSNTESYYPSEQEQQDVQDLANAKDTRFHLLKKQFEESEFSDNDTYNFGRDVYNKFQISAFLNDAMFIRKTIPVVSEKRKRIELSQSLYMYVSGSGDISEFMTEQLLDYYNKSNYKQLFNN